MRLYTSTFGENSASLSCFYVLLLLVEKVVSMHSRMASRKMGALILDL
jgi:hypothetical protein